MDTEQWKGTPLKREVSGFRGNLPPPPLTGTSPRPDSRHPDLPAAACGAGHGRLPPGEGFAAAAEPRPVPPAVASPEHGSQRPPDPAPRTSPGPVRPARPGQARPVPLPGQRPRWRRGPAARGAAPRRTRGRLGRCLR